MNTDPGAKLAVSISDSMTVEVRLGLKEIRIGRGREADLQLPDRSVSRFHARIYRFGNRYFLADLGSRNGTHFNGKPVTQLPLDDGQTFTIGPYRIHFLWPAGAPMPGEEPTVAPGASLPPSNATAVSGPGTTSSAESASASSPKRVTIERETANDTFGMVGESRPIRKLIDTIRRVGPSDAAVLIEGETGSGKELVARGLHNASNRSYRPFIVVNCGAISPELVESELFGHERGAFTGATAQRRGAFELAHNGTIFLDEIGELPYTLQPKLLRALEQKEIKRVGGNETLLANARILAATNRNLKEEITKKTFREDLYFRVGAISISAPPLRERKEDIVPLSRHFLALLSAGSTHPIPTLSHAALDILISHDWPGNVRELRNAIQRAVVMAEGEELAAADFSFLSASSHTSSSEQDTSQGLTRWEQAERTNILAELSRQSGNKTRTARVLGIAKSTLFEKLKKYGISSQETDR
ncbi:MAG: sigma 54-dependent Fis family transcriptional regulator [Syntrophorhabdaceae bacterium]|nr:sigma 54-dependent Fis family transcriptional regulator [Syntrophorhabdaceae bacterium]